MEEIEIIKKNYLELIAEELSSIDTDNADKWSYDENPSIKIVEEQKTYFWIRLYLNDENQNIKIGSDITIRYQPMPSFLNDVFSHQESYEELDTKFICYDKKGMERNHDGEIVNYNQEDDNRVLCLMVDSSNVNGNNQIPFIRTLFKASRHYDYQLIRRTELLFIDKVTGENLEYYDCSF
jgi:hypothetical protein